MDLDDLLEDLWEDVMGDARQRANRVGEQLRRKARLPSVRRRMREVALWGSGMWFATFGGLGVASELAIDGGWGTLLAVLMGGIALPAVPAGVWAWRTRVRDRAAARAAETRRRIKDERDELPPDVVADWQRLRRAQVLVEDLARQGYVEVAALGEQMAVVGELRELLVADQRAAELGAPPSARLRDQVREVGDLLVALAAEAVDHRTTQVGQAGAPATLRDARERLATLRLARAEVDAVDEDAARANDLVERARQEQRSSATSPRRPDSQRPGDSPRPRDEDGGTPMATPG